MPSAAPPSTSRVQTALSSATGTTVRVVHTDHLQPWSVMRCLLAEPLPDGGATTVIVKWVRTEAGNERTQPARLRIERVALEFVATRAPHLVPRVLSGGDDGLLILDDVAPREPLRELVLRVGPLVAQPGLIEFVRALGQLHAATAGQADAYYRRLGASTADGVAHDVAVSVGQWELGVERARDAGVSMSTAAGHELAGVIDGLLHPGPHLALSNGDPETNNYLTDGTSGRLIDFESAGFQHVFIDVASLYVPGPMWLTVGNPTRTAVRMPTDPRSPPSSRRSQRTGSSAMALPVQLWSKPSDDWSTCRSWTSASRASPAACTGSRPPKPRLTPPTGSVAFRT